MSDYQKLDAEMRSLCQRVTELGGDVLSVARNWMPELGREGNLLHQILDLKAEIKRLEARKLRHDPPQCADCGQYSCVCEGGPCFLSDEEDFDF